MTMIVHARKVNSAMRAELQRRIEAVPGHGRAPLIIKTFDTYVTQTSLAPLHIAGVILGASAAFALLLSVVGLFSALSEAGRQRRRELAVRIALGAQRWHVIRQVLGEGWRIASGGAAAGMAGSLPLSRWLSGITLVPGAPALWVWLYPPVVLAAMVALASFVPARRAWIVNPLMIMRDDH
jgi:ABC-type antimicrobial peptide transport system permease subunit